MSKVIRTQAVNAGELPRGVDNGVRRDLEESRRALERGSVFSLNACAAFQLNNRFWRKCPLIVVRSHFARVLNLACSHLGNLGLEFLTESDQFVTQAVFRVAR